MAVYIFMSLSIIFGIILLLDFFGYFSRSKEKFDIEIDDYSTNRRRKSIDIHRIKQESRRNDKRNAA
ncbi:MAG: hypothetical protein K8S87_01435 [Planctomycetes bacterium]|nr:hypothetical protein [Planctomycetota bacterium]